MYCNIFAVEKINKWLHTMLHNLSSCTPFYRKDSSTRLIKHNLNSLAKYFKWYIRWLLQQIYWIWTCNNNSRIATTLDLCSSKYLHRCKITVRKSQISVKTWVLKIIGKKVEGPFNLTCRCVCIKLRTHRHSLPKTLIDLSNFNLDAICISLRFELFEYHCY